MPNTGGGGGGVRNDGGFVRVGNGGSGIVIVRISPTFVGRDALSQWLGSSPATVVTWYDQSGSGNHATDIRGNPRLTSFGTQNYLYGTTADGLRFPSAILPSTYTLFHVARYADSGQQGRIFDGVQGDWASGFFAGASGFAYHDGTVTSHSNRHGRNLLVSVDQNTPDLYRSNGVDRTFASTNSATKRLSINYGAFGIQFPEQLSDWIVHEVLVYNSTLPLTRILKTERALMQRYLGSTDEISLASRTGARGLFALRELSGTWNGPALTVTRSSDGQRADVYFDPDGKFRYAVPVLENPKMTSNSAIDTDFQTAYGWDTSSGWSASASSGTANAAFGKGGSVWHSAYVANLTTTPVWLRLDYPYAVHLQRYELMTRDTMPYSQSDFPNTFQVQGSNDGTTWKSIDSRSGQASLVTAQYQTLSYLVGSSESFRYYRLNVTGVGVNNGGRGTNDNYVVLAEFRLFATIATTRTLHGLSAFQGWLAGTALLQNPKMTSNSSVDTDYQSAYGWDTNVGWAASASAQVAGTTASGAFNKVVDVIGSDGWQGATKANMTESPEWLRLDFPYMVKLSRYEILSRNGGLPFSRYDFPNTFQVQGSNDGTNWTMIDSQTNQAILISQAYQTLAYTVSTTLFFRYYRLYITGVGANNGGRGNGTFNPAIAEMRYFVDYPRTVPLVETWYDQSGNGRHAVQSTVASRPVLRFGSDLAPYLDFRTSRFFNLPDGTVPTGNSAYSFVVQHGDIDNATNGTLIASGSYGTSNATNNLRRDAGAKGYFNYWFVNDLYFGTYAKNNIVAATYDGTNNRGFVNGTNTDSRTPTTVRNSTSTGNYIGIANGTVEPLNGDLYYVGIFGTALSQSEVQSLGIRAQTKPVGALDDISTTLPIVGLGLRLLFASYSGPVIRVRRSTDNVQANVYFDRRGTVTRVSRVDTSADSYGARALSVFQGSGNLQVVTWYDQSGNGNHAQEVSSAAPVFFDPLQKALLFTTSANSYLTIAYSASSMNFSAAQTIAMELRPAILNDSYRHNPYNQAHGGPGTLTIEGLALLGGAGSVTYYFGTNGGDNPPYNSTFSNPILSTQRLTHIVANRNQSANTSRWFASGSLVTSSNAGGYATTANGTSPIWIGNGYAGKYSGSITSLNVWNVALSDDQVKRTYDSTRTFARGALDGVAIAPVAAYSLRLLYGTYSGPAVRVRRSTDNVEAEVFVDYAGNVTNVAVPSTGEVILGANALSTFQGAGTLSVVTWYDQSGNGNHGTGSNVSFVNDGTYWVTRYNGSSSVVTIPYSAAFNVTTGLTIQSHIKYTADTFAFTFEKGNVNTQYSLFAENSFLGFRTVHSDAATNDLYISKASAGVSSNAWYNICATFDGTTKTIYVEGTSRGTSTKAVTLTTTTAGSAIGRFGGTSTGYFLTGDVNEIIIYGSGLTNAQVRSIQFP